MHVIQFLSTKIWILKWRKWLFIQWNIDKFQENWKSLTFITNLTSMSMTQFYVETEGLWFGPKIKMIWESALWIWLFCYQHRLVVLDAICCSWQLNIFLDIEAPPPTIWASKPPHYFLRTQHPPTEVHPDQWISWSLVTLVMALLLIIQAMTLYTLDHASVTSRGVEEILSRAVQTIALPGPYIWCTHTWYTTVHPYEDQDLCCCSGLSVFLLI